MSDKKQQVGQASRLSPSSQVQVHYYEADAEAHRLASAFRLTAEADRYIRIAKDIAYDLLLNPFSADAEKKKRLAQDHTLRAETFLAAAHLISPSQIK